MGMLRRGRINQQNTDGINIAITGSVRDVSISETAEHFSLTPYPVDRKVDHRSLSLSRLLAAQYGIVPFTGRETELTHLARWRDSPDPTAVLLVHAVGGQGKTRLAAEFASRSARLKWRVLQARHHSDPRPDSGEQTSTPKEDHVLVIVDYAESCPRADLPMLFQHPRLARARRCRVLLLARPAGLWWSSLQHPFGELNIATQRMKIAAVADSTGDRRMAFSVAFTKFAKVLGLSSHEVSLPANISDPAYGPILGLHMAALAAVHARLHGDHPPDDPAGASSYLLEREYAHWYTAHENGRIDVRPEIMARLVFVATLMRPASRTDAAALIIQLGLAATEPSACSLLDAYSVFYPPLDHGDPFPPLYPDRLGEDFVARMLPEADALSEADPWAADALARSFTLAIGDRQHHVGQTITLLVGIARRWPHVAESHLYPPLRRDPAFALAATGEALVSLAGMADLDLLSSIEQKLTLDESSDLALAAAAISRRLTTAKLDRCADPAERADLHKQLAWRLTSAGLHEEAIEHTRQAIQHYRQAADASDDEQDAFTLAMVLNDLSAELALIGNPAEAATTAREAATTLRQHTRSADPDIRYALSRALQNLSVSLSNSGHFQEALEHSHEALRIRAQLALENQIRVSDVLRTADIFTKLLSVLGKHDESLQLYQNSIPVRKEMNQRRMLDAAGLASIHNGLGILLLKRGQPREAVPVLEQAIQLLDHSRRAGRDDELLGQILTALGQALSQIGRVDDALQVTKQAVDKLVSARSNQDEPDVHLAVALNHLSLHLAHSGRVHEALNPIEQAVNIRRDLARTNPSYYESDLGLALGNLGLRLSDVGRHAEAAEVTAEAVSIHRRLSRTELKAHSHKLALSLRAFAKVRATAQQDLEHSLSIAQEAIALFVKLENKTPGAYMSDVYTMGIIYADLLETLGRTAEAQYLRQSLHITGTRR